METVVRALMLAALLAATAAAAGTVYKSTAPRRQRRLQRSSTGRRQRVDKVISSSDDLPSSPVPPRARRNDFRAQHRGPRHLRSRSRHTAPRSCCTWRAGAPYCRRRKSHLGSHSGGFHTTRSTSNPRSAACSSRPKRGGGGIPSSGQGDRATSVDSRRKATIAFLRVGSDPLRYNCLPIDHLTRRRCMFAALYRSPLPSWERSTLQRVKRERGRRRRRLLGRRSPSPQPLPHKGEGA